LFIVSQPRVARFVEDFDKNNESYLNSHRLTYHKAFIRTPAKASGFAAKFNRKIEKKIQTSHRHLVPIIEFLRPLIFELDDQKEGGPGNPRSFDPCWFLSGAAF
jgi:hypothetical protein